MIITSTPIKCATIQEEVLLHPQITLSGMAQKYFEDQRLKGMVTVNYRVEF